MTWQRPPHVRGGSHSLSSPLLCGKQVRCLRWRGRDRATHRRKEAGATCPSSRTPARAAQRRRRKRHRSCRRPKSDPLRRGAGDPAPPARMRPRPRGRHGLSSSRGAEEPLPRSASVGREREGRESGRCGRRRVGLRACLRRRREVASRRREADGPRSRRPATLGGRRKTVGPRTYMRDPLPRHRKPPSKQERD
jgi:hypothetical protein